MASKPILTGIKALLVSWENHHETQNSFMISVIRASELHLRDAISSQLMLAAEEGRQSLIEGRPRAKSGDLLRPEVALRSHPPPRPHLPTARK
jgi:hypothetical protein